MRNIQQYPITVDETLRVVTGIQDSVSYKNTQQVGDMRPVILSYLKQFIEEDKEAFQNFLDAKMGFTKADQLGRLKKIASKLSFRASVVRWKPEDVQEIEIDGETIKVGPFLMTDSAQMWSGQCYCWQETPNDAYVLYMDCDDWDSWGTHYSMDEMGNNFNIGKIAKTTPMIEDANIYDFDTPVRKRW